MRRTGCLGFASIVAGAALTAAPVFAQAPDAGQANPPRFDSTVVVTADRIEEPRIDAPTSIVVLSGRTLELRGVRTLADAFSFIPGLEVFHGADEGPLTAGVALWGFREFDAYALFIDGVPVGGTYNPNTAFVPIEEIDRIEVQKGPNAVLFGQTAFAGVIQVFTRAGAAGDGRRGFVAVNGGSLSSVGASGSIDLASNAGQVLRLTFSAQGSDGWQPRAGSREERMELSYMRPLATGQMRATARVLDRTQGFGSPFPRAGADVDSTVRQDENYAVRDAEIGDRIVMGTFFVNRGMGRNLAFVNTSSVSFDSQSRIRGFLSNLEPVADAEGSALEPRQLDIFQDAHIEWKKPWGNRASWLQVGGSYQFGRLESKTRLFDYTVSLASPNPPRSTELDADEAEFFNRRDFGGLYIHEQIALNSRVSVSGGARLDFTREHQRVGGDRPGEIGLEDSATHTAVSYRAAVTGRAISTDRTYTNLFASYNHAFKPAAVNFAEPNAVRPILEPEIADSIEGGAKFGLANGRLDLQASLFQMNFQHLIVSQVQNGLVVLLNAGEERFRGFEVDAGTRPIARLPVHATLGYSYHNPIFTDFSTINAEGELLVLAGKRLELAPRHLFTAQVDYGSERGWGGFAALRTASSRPVNRRNTAFADGYQVVDAGVAYGFGRYRIVATGWNLTDSRHIVAESELADAQVYLSPPRRGSVELRVRF